MTLNLDHLASLAEAATPGPWAVSRGDDYSCMNVYGVTTNGAEVDFAVNDTGRDVVCLTLLQDPRVACHESGRWDENAAFIAASRTAVPALIARVRELEAENANLRRENERLRDLEREMGR